MSTYQPSNTLVSFVDESIFLPSDATQMRVKLTDSLRDYAIAINSRSIGYYDQQERITGNLLFNPLVLQKLRPGFRKTIDFGSLPNATTKRVAHGIAINSNFVFFKCWGVATNPNATPDPSATDQFAIPLPYSSGTALNENIKLYISKTNVVIETAIDYSRFTKCAVVVEYIKF